MDAETLDKLQDEIAQWHRINYPNDDLESSLLGVMEELGELNRVQLKQDGGIRGTWEYWEAEKQKEVGDVVIGLINFCSFADIKFSSIVADSGLAVVEFDTAKKALLCVGSSTGRLIEDQIFIVNKDKQKQSKYALSFIYDDLTAYCNFSGTDLMESVVNRWDTISKRDFIKNPETGGREQEEVKIFDPSKTLLEMIADRPSSWEAVNPDGHNGDTCDCDPDFGRNRKSPGVCIVEPCHYAEQHKKGQTHSQYHGWRYSNNADVC